MLLEEPPKIIRLRDSYTNDEGSRFHALCSVEKGSTPLFFQWIKNGEKIISNENVKIEMSDSFANIVIANVKRSDSGNYTCNVKNAFGSDTYTVNLVVRGTLLLLYLQV